LGAGFALADVEDVTPLLQAIAAGDPTAGDRLIPLVYAELRQMAAQRMARHAGGGEQTLQPTALVHEAWLRLGGGDGQLGGNWENRAHFFAAAASAMRSILVDRARRRMAARHGGGRVRVDVDDTQLADPADPDDQVLAVHDALERFAVTEPKKAELVKLRYFAGLSLAEAGEVLGISEPTAKRWWAYARGWLGREIQW
jgi:RNA polymerase sigma factor (TIGR02999 family)